jgi:putative ABC transport system permease protein
MLLILLANCIAWPLAWYFMDQWLNTFAYHIDTDVLIYLIAAAGAILLALVTVSTQTVRAAMSNPAKTLRYE